MPIKKPRFNWFRQRPHKVIAWFQGHEKTASWLGAAFTGLIFLVTAIYAAVAFFQMRAMNATVQQTQVLIAQQKESLDYARTQADAAKTAADAALIQAKTMQEQTGTLKSSLDETRKAANAAVTQANASMSQAETTKTIAKSNQTSAEIAKEATRPIITGKVQIESLSEKQISGKLVIRNDGGKQTEVTARWCPYYSVLPKKPTVEDCKPAIVSGPLRPALHVDFPVVIKVDTESIVKLARERKVYLFFVATLTYDDFGERRELPICYVYREEFQAIGDCSDLTNPKNLNPNQ